ncbi:MAG TPA: hypothetical protein VFI73_08670 [Candidatus Nitrosopolaris sp.]|nr:hypothetical protein [Candidatus Nitrosopolaris sp.]
MVNNNRANIASRRQKVLIPITEGMSYVKIAETIGVIKDNILRLSVFG